MNVSDAVVDARSFGFSAPSGVGTYDLCFVSGTPVVDAETSFIFYPTWNVGAPFRALPVIRNVTSRPATEIAGTPLTITAYGSLGLQSTDDVFLCEPAMSLDTVSRASLTDALVWNARIDAAGVYQLCINTTATPPLPLMTPFGPTITVEPSIDRVEPAALAAGSPVSVSVVGVSFGQVTRLVFDPAQRPCRSLNVAGDSTLLTFPVTNGAATLELAHRGESVICYTGISGKAFPVVQPLTVQPVVDTIVPAATQGDIFAGCVATLSVNGSGFDTSRDEFFVTTHPTCSGDPAAVMFEEGGVVAGPRRRATLQVVVSAAGTFYMCYRPENSTTALARGTFASHGPFQVTYDNATNNGEWHIRFKCPYTEAGWQYDFAAAPSSASRPLPLDDVVSAPEVRIKYLPTREAFVTMDGALAEPATNRRAVGTSATRDSVAFCTNVPTAFTTPASTRKQWAEAYFVTYNYVHLGCAPTTGRSETTPDVAFEKMLGLLASDPSLDQDQAATLTLLTTVLPSTTDPIASGVNLLQSSAGGLVPYQAADAAVIQAHMSASPWLLIS